MKIYIAGPMRGYKYFNFPAFDAAKSRLIADGWEVVSPADLDRAIGHDPHKLPDDWDWNRYYEGFDFCRTVESDVAVLRKCQAVFLLDGWEKSKGATAEKALAEWLGLRVIYERDEDVLEEALRITRGDRNASYGPPDQDFQRTAAMWTAMKGVHFEAREVAMFMIALKLSRETHQRRRDNWVDIAGYARCGSLCK